MSGFGQLFNMRALMRLMQLLMALTALGLLVFAIAQAVNPGPSQVADPINAVRASCDIVVSLDDFVFSPGYAADGSLETVLVHKTGVDPNKAWVLLSYEEGYKEFNAEKAWHAAVENLSGNKGLGPKMLRAGDLWLTKTLGYAPQREIWDTSGFGAFASYIQCFKVIAKATKNGSPIWSAVPIP